MEKERKTLNIILFTTIAAFVLFAIGTILMISSLFAFSSKSATTILILGIVFSSIFGPVSFGISIAILCINWQNPWSKLNKTLWGILSLLVIPFIGIIVFVVISKKHLDYIQNNNNYYGKHSNNHSNLLLNDVKVIKNSNKNLYEVYLPKENTNVPSKQNINVRTNFALLFFGCLFTILVFIGWWSILNFNDFMDATIWISLSLLFTLLMLLCWAFYTKKLSKIKVKNYRWLLVLSILYTTFTLLFFVALFRFLTNENDLVNKLLKKEGYLDFIIASVVINLIASIISWCIYAWKIKQAKQHELIKQFEKEETTKNIDNHPEMPAITFDKNNWLKQLNEWLTSLNTNFDKFELHQIIFDKVNELENKSTTTQF